MRRAPHSTKAPAFVGPKVMRPRNFAGATRGVLCCSQNTVFADLLFDTLCCPLCRTLLRNRGQVLTSSMPR